MIIIIFISLILIVGGAAAVYFGIQNHNPEYRTIGIVVIGIGLLLLLAGIVAPANERKKDPTTPQKSWTEINPLYRNPYQPPGPLD